MRRIDGWWLVASLLAGCADSGPDKSPAREPLRVAAASDLQAALPEIARRFEQTTGVAAVFTPGASGNLAQQVRQGGPFDVFLAANRKFVEDLAAEGIIRPDSVRPYARGTLVLAVRRESRDAVKSLDDLKKPGVARVALANPKFAPYGAAGRQALERAGLWGAIEPKVVQAETVRQALQFVQSGNADAGLVGKAITDVPGVGVVPIDEKLYDPIVQGLGVVARSGRAEDAEKFAEFLLGEPGQAILSGFGFARPEPPTERSP